VRSTSRNLTKNKAQDAFETWIRDSEIQLKQSLRIGPGVRASRSRLQDQQPKENEMSILSAIGRFTAEYSAARKRHLFERELRSLPAEIQKDIGWPYHSGSQAGDK
jgi:hypothetical protein